MDIVRIDIKGKVWTVAIKFEQIEPSQYDLSKQTIYLNPDLDSLEMQKELVYCLAEISCVGQEDDSNYPKLLEKARAKARMFISKTQSGNPFVQEKRNERNLRFKRNKFNKMIAAMESTNV